MRLTCMCGGRFRRSDFVRIEQGDKTLYQDTDPTAAHWKCSDCGRTRSQKKRQATLKPKAQTMRPQIILIDDNYAYGPFESLGDSQLWLESHYTTGFVRCINLYDPPSPGTADHAHHCGSVTEAPKQDKYCPRFICGAP